MKSSISSLLPAAAGEDARHTAAGTAALPATGNCSVLELTRDLLSRHRRRRQQDHMRRRRWHHNARHLNHRAQRRRPSRRSAGTRITAPRGAPGLRRCRNHPRAGFPHLPRCRRRRRPGDCRYTPPRSGGNPIASHRSRRRYGYCSRSRFRRRPRSDRDRRHRFDCIRPRPAGEHLPCRRLGLRDLR